MRRNVAGVLRQAFEQVPGQTALTLLHNHQPEQAVSYDGLMRGSAAYAQALAGAGIQPGEVVILILPHGTDLVFAFFGAILAGAVPSIMPFLTEKLSPDQYRASLAALFEITAPAAVVTYPEFESEVAAARQQAGANLKAILLSSQAGAPCEPDFSQMAGLQRAPEEIVLLQHSSGTTGLQKGVALAHQAVFNQLDSYGHALRLVAEDVIVSWLPLYHDMGLIAGFLLPILCRVPLVLLSPFDWVRAPYKLFQAVSQHHGSLTWLPNFAYNFCAQKIRARDLENVDLASWRAVINCSEPMHWKSHQMFLERFQPYGLRPSALATCYAMAENVFAVSQGGIAEPVTVDWVEERLWVTEGVARPAPAGDPAALPMLSAGRPIDNTRLRVLDAQDQYLPERRMGEIALQSDCMLTGYYHRPDATAQAMRDGWYLTGDLGYLANGEIYVTGRKKDLIIVGGKNIYPQDIERLAGEVPGVHPGRVVAFGVYSEAAGTEEVVVVAEADLPPEELAGGEAGLRMADEIRQRVTRGSDIALRYVRVVARNWLLKTSSGKIARSANRAKYLAEL